MSETSVEKAILDAQAIIRSQRPVFTRQKGWRAVKAKGKYIGTADNDAEHEALLQKVQDETTEGTLFWGQSRALQELADHLYPGLARAYAKAYDTVFNRLRDDCMRVDELERLQEWNRKKLNRMNDVQKKRSLEIRKRITGNGA